MGVRYNSRNVKARDHFRHLTHAIENNSDVTIEDIVSEGVDWNYLSRDIVKCPSPMRTTLKFSSIKV
jgi:hypothetical protein